MVATSRKFNTARGRIFWRSNSTSIVPPSPFFTGWYAQERSCEGITYSRWIFWSRGLRRRACKRVQHGGGAFFWNAVFIESFARTPRSTASSADLDHSVALSLSRYTLFQFVRWRVLYHKLSEIEYLVEEFELLLGDLVSWLF